MKLLRTISIPVFCLMLADTTSAQISLTPPAAQTPAPKPAAKKAAPKEKPKAPTVAKKPAAAPKPAATPSPTPSPGAAFEDPNVDLVYGAYQRGLYKTAFDLASTRAQYAGDAKAMTMLGELYANALGIKRDYAKAAEWYKRAADAGDREGMFALAMMRLSGRADATAFHLDAGRLCVLLSRHRVACWIFGRDGISRQLRRYAPTGDRSLGISDDPEFEGWRSNTNLMHALARAGRIYSVPARARFDSTG